MFCQQCGAQIPASATRYCGNCGGAQRPAPPPPGRRPSPPPLPPGRQPSRPPPAPIRMGSAPPPESAPTSSIARILLGVFAAGVGLIVLLLIVVAVARYRNATSRVQPNSPASSAGHTLSKEESAALEKKLLSGSLENYLKAMRQSPTAPRSASPPGPKTAGIGDDVMVHSGPWICGSTKEALGEMVKRAVRHDSSEMFRTMRRTHSFALTDGFQVKILDRGFVSSKVRVTGWLDPDDGRIHAYPEEKRIGRECWVPSEAVRR
jgi:hypothetical protein